MACIFYDGFPVGTDEPNCLIGFTSEAFGEADPDETTFDITLAHSSGLSYDAMVGEVWQDGFAGTKTAGGNPSQFDWVITTHPDLLVGTWTVTLVGTCVAGTWLPVPPLEFTITIDCADPAVSNGTPSGATTTEPTMIGCVIDDEWGLDLSSLRLDVVSSVGTRYRAVDGGQVQTGWGGNVFSDGNDWPNHASIQLLSWPEDITSGMLWTFEIGVQNKVQKNLGESTFTSNLCFEFDGVWDVTWCGDVLDFAHTDPFSISVWIKTTDVTAIILAKYDHPDPGYRMFLDVGKVRLDLRDAGGGLIIVTGAAATISDGNWHHVVARYDGSVAAAGVSFFFDGQVATPVVVSNTLAATMVSANQLLIASQDSGVLDFTGRMVDLSFWDVALSTAEVVETWNGGSPGDLLTHSAWNNNLAWWRLGTGDIFPVILDHGIHEHHAQQPLMSAFNIVEDSP